MRLYKKIDNYNCKRKLVAPRVITIFQKCIEHKIQDTFLNKLHFNDLYFLIMSLDIAACQQYLKQLNRLNKKNLNFNVKEIEPQEALKFLKG